MFSRSERLTIVAAAVGCVVAGALTVIQAGSVVRFAAAGIALALLATLVGQATERLGERLGPGATGVLQSALGNLPELFVGIFALRAGLVEVVQASLVGSILGNSLFGACAGLLRRGSAPWHPALRLGAATDDCHVDAPGRVGVGPADARARSAHAGRARRRNV